VLDPGEGGRAHGGNRYRAEEPVEAEQEDRPGRVRGDLQWHRYDDAGPRCRQARTLGQQEGGAQDGGCRAQEAPALPVRVPLRECLLPPPTPPRLLRFLSALGAPCRYCELSRARLQVHCGHFEDHNYLVMELLGENLSELRRRRPGGRFSLWTTVRLGIQMLRAVEVRGERKERGGGSCGDREEGTERMRTECNRGCARSCIVRGRRGVAMRARVFEW
jgi:hypothetical protein